MKYRFLSTLAIVMLIQIGCSKPEVISSEFIGNYFDTTGTDYWTCSIFADYLIYENDFWNYKIKASSEKEIKLQIFNKSGDKRRIKISKADTSYILNDGKQEIICCRSSEDIRVKPGKEVPIWEAGVAVIKGVVLGDTSKNVQVKIKAAKYFTTRDSEVRIAEVDAQGRFSISIPMLTSQSVFLFCCDQSWRRIFLTPGDSLTMLIDGQSGRPVHFMGTNADVCYHMENVLDTLHQLSEVRTRNWGLEPMDFWEYMDSLSLVQYDFLESYSAEKQCSDLCVHWCKSFIDCSRGNELGRYPFMSTKHGMGAVNRLEVDHPYFDFIESVNFNDTMLILEAMAGNLVGNLDNYYHKVLRQEINSEARIHQDIYAFLNDYTNQISEEDIRFIESLSDSLATYGAFSRSLVNRLVSIADPFKDEYDYRLMKAQIDRRIEYFIGLDYSLMRDLLLMKVYADMKRARKLDVMDHVYNRIDTLIQYPVFKEDLKNDYSAFLAKIESLQNIEFVANKSSESGEKLLLDIINSSRDTIVVLDFWYTACGPCRTGFEKMKSIKKQMYDVPIKFVYLCYSSSEKDWSNVIKELEVKGDHYLLTGAQFAYFSNLLNISSAPRYVLIGRDGKIVNDNFVQPQSYQQYMGALRKYLAS